MSGERTAGGTVLETVGAGGFGGRGHGHDDRCPRSLEGDVLAAANGVDADGNESPVDETDQSVSLP